MSPIIRLLWIILSLLSIGIVYAQDQLSIEISGLSGNLEKNTNQALKNSQAQMRTQNQEVAAFYKKAPTIIKKALQPYGYFNPTIQSSLSKKGTQWIAHFNIIPGPAVHITQVTIHIIGPAKNDPAFKRLYDHLPLKVGHTLNTENYEKTKQLLYDLASTRGYFDAKMLENKIYINLKNRTAQVILKFQSGPRYYFSDTLFSKNPFSPEFLMRFLHYKKGELYNYQKIEKTQQSFIDSNYFSHVIIRPLRKNAKNQWVPIEIKIIPKKRYAYIIGAGYGTDTNFRATLGFDIRHVNPYGHQVKSLIQASKTNSHASVSYLIPGRRPSSDIWGLSTGYANFDQVTGNGKSFKLEGSYTTALGKWKQTLALTFLNERYNIINFPFTQTKVLYPNIHWQYISTQNQLYPTHGFSFSGFVGGTPQLSSISDISFLQARANANLLFTLFGSTRFILRTALARTNIKNIQNLPFSLQLFAGGARSIRGYSYNQIGPGRNLFTASLEIQQRIKGKWYLAGFFDAGNVSDNNPFKNLNIGVGPGIAWLSPVGVIEITIARAITRPSKPWVIQFIMGPEL